MNGTERMAERRRLAERVVTAACRWHGWHEPDRPGMDERDAALYDAVTTLLGLADGGNQ